MVDVAARRAASRQPAQEDDEDRVHDGDDENQRRRCRSGERRGARDCERRARREEAADRQTAAVAHEDLRRIAVPREKSEERACERDEQGRSGAKFGREHDRQRERGDRGDARRQAVHVVEQVDGVVDEAEPDDGNDRERRLQGSGPDAAKRVDEERRDGERADHLLERRHRHQIVVPAGGKECDSGGAERQQRSERARRHDRECDRDGEQNRDAAVGRRRRPVPTVGARRDDDAGPSRRARVSRRSR